MAETVQITGLKELGDRLRALPAEIASKNGGPLRVALAKMARRIRDEAKRRVPVATGSLRDNIIILRDRNPRRSGMTERYLVTVRSRSKQRKYGNTKRNRRLGRAGQSYGQDGSLFYARFIEFGTARSRAQPFLRPAIESLKAELPAMFQRELSIAINRAVRKLGARR